MEGKELETQPQVKLGETARTVADLLSQASGFKNLRVQDPKGELSQGWYMGDGTPTVPPKLADRIGKGSTLRCDLLPEFWIIPRSEEEVTSQRLAKSRGRKRTQEIHVWLQCFAVYVAVVASKCPSHRCQK